MAQKALAFAVIYGSGPISWGQAVDQYWAELVVQRHLAEYRRIIKEKDEMAGQKKIIVDGSVGSNSPWTLLTVGPSGEAFYLGHKSIGTAGRILMYAPPGTWHEAPEERPTPAPPEEPMIFTQSWVYYQDEASGVTVYHNNNNFREDVMDSLITPHHVLTMKLNGLEQSYRIKKMGTTLEGRTLWVGIYIACKFPDGSTRTRNQEYPKFAARGPDGLTLRDALSLLELRHCVVWVTKPE